MGYLKKPLPSMRLAFYIPLFIHSKWFIPKETFIAAFSQITKVNTKKRMTSNVIYNIAYIESEEKKISINTRNIAYCIICPRYHGTWETPEELKFGCLRRYRGPIWITSCYDDYTMALRRLHVVELRSEDVWTASCFFRIVFMRR